MHGIIPLMKALALSTDSWGWAWLSCVLSLMTIPWVQRNRRMMPYFVLSFFLRYVGNSCLAWRTAMQVDTPIPCSRSSKMNRSSLSWMGERDNLLPAWSVLCCPTRSSSTMQSMFRIHRTNKLWCTLTDEANALKDVPLTWFCSKASVAMAIFCDKEINLRRHQDITQTLLNYEGGGRKGWCQKRRILLHLIMEFCVQCADVARTP